MDINLEVPLLKEESYSHSQNSIPEVFQLIDLVNKKLAQIQRLTFKEANLTPAQYYILTLLWERDRRQFKEFAEALHCTRATITGIVDTLEKKGLVARTTHPTDRRSLLVTLTEEGKEFRDKTPNLGQIFSLFCSGLQAEKFKQLGILLQKLSQSLDCECSS